jgi:hypothetical protein
MKSIFVVALAAVSLNYAFAQGITEFSATLPPNTEPSPEGMFQAQETAQFVVQLRGSQFFLGEGTFQLTGTTLSYNVRADPGFDVAAIHGPAQPGMDAPKIFDLRRVSCVPPLPGGGGGDGCFYVGSFALTQEQISQLSSEQWYVYSVVSHLPDYFLRGQITVVPEARSIWLWGLMLSLLLLPRRFLRRRGSQTTEQFRRAQFRTCGASV